MTVDFINRKRIILASKSPRRSELLKELGLKFEVVLKDYVEDYPANLTGKDIALHVARGKADLFRNGISHDEIVITADTIVWCNGRVLDKPVDFTNAVSVLREISGNTHEVITGVCILSAIKEKAFYASTKVTFDVLAEEEITYYVNKYRPYDKAGAYGIQEWIGIAACSHIEGSYFNVMGLPVHILFKELKDFAGC
jgi:septum formation protein